MKTHFADDETLKHIAKLERDNRELREALERIAFAKPDRLDHAIDVAIIERAANIAGEVLEKTK
jgi:hypothetical protein